MKGPVLLRIPAILLFLFLPVGPVPAHEFWIDPEAFQVEPGGTITADLRVGQMFAGQRLRYFADDTARHRILAPPGLAERAPRVGDAPAFRATAGDAGLVVLVHETSGDRVAYRTDDLFPAFVAHKDLAGVLERHTARGLPLSGFIETYTRYAKSLIAVGSGAGTDRRIGMRTELVALGNPYTEDPAKGLRVQLILDDSAKADARVEVFDRGAKGAVTSFFLRTDADGTVVVPVTPGHSYLVDAVAMFELPGNDVANDPMWHSLWASLTFAVPE